MNGGNGSRDKGLVYGLRVESIESLKVPVSRVHYIDSFTASFLLTGANIIYCRRRKFP